MSAAAPTRRRNLVIGFIAAAALAIGALAGRAAGSEDAPGAPAVVVREAPARDAGDPIVVPAPIKVPEKLPGA